MSDALPQETGPVNIQSLEKIIWIDPERMGGQPCFYGTRVPIKILLITLRVVHLKNYILNLQAAIWHS